MDSDTDINRTLYDAYKDRLLFNSLENKVIMYSNGRAYEYNNRTHKIRPFTSVIWYSLLDKDYEDFIFYLDDKIENAYRTRYDEQYDDSIITFDGTVAKINISTLHKQLYDMNDEKIKPSFDNLVPFMKNIYDINYVLLRRLISKQADLLYM